MRRLAGLPFFGLDCAVPKDVIAQLSAAVVNALADPVVRERVGALGGEIPPREELTPEALGAPTESRH